MTAINRNLTEIKYVGITIPTLFLFLYLLSLSIELLNFLPIVAVFTMRMMLGIFSALYAFQYIDRMKSVSLVILFIVVYVVCGFIAYFYNGNSDLVELFWPIAFMCPGIMFINFDFSWNQLKYPFILIFILAFYLAITEKVTSLNSFNELLLLMTSIVAIILHKEHKYSSWLLFFLILSLFAVLFTVGEHGGGRSGVIVFVYLLIANLFYYFIYNREKQTKNKFFTNYMLIFFHGIILLYLFYVNIDTILLRFTYLEMRGLTSLRTLIWKDYLSLIYTSDWGWLLGAGFKNTTLLLNNYSENLHNSFLMLHAKYTIVMLIIVLLLTSNAVYFFLKNKFYLLLIFFIALLFRTNFDYTNFNSLSDSIFIYYMFCPFYYFKR